MSEDRDTDLDKEEDIRMDKIRDKHWRDVAEEGYNRQKMHDLRWGI